jgi:hypothetical protein
MGATKGEKLKTLGHDLLVPATPQHKVNIYYLIDIYSLKSVLVNSACTKSF